MLKLALFFVCLFSLNVQANPYKVVEIETTRVVSIKGQIDGETLAILPAILKLADNSGRDIHMIINSQGGSVMMGGQILSAMKMAQSRGHKIICYVPIMAASMGFQILAQCDVRYAFKHSLLLWHPMKINGEMSLSGEDLLYHSNRIRAWEKPFILDLVRALGISTKTFVYHYKHETLWMGFEFEKIAPGFVTVVDDIRGVPDLFEM